MVVLCEKIEGQNWNFNSYNLGKIWNSLTIWILFYNDFTMEFKIIYGRQKRGQCLNICL